MNASPIDWIITAAFLGLLGLLGLLGPGGWTCKYVVKNVAEFLAADRHMRKFHCLGSYASSGTETSTGLTERQSLWGSTAVGRRFFFKVRNSRNWWSTP